MSRLWLRASIGILACALLAWPRFVAAADWFVAPGKPTGDGSRQQPFNDPWRALAAASANDSIHIAQGVYYGRYDRSAWVIDRPKLTILGGYDREFTRRDPWKQPTVLAFYRDYEGTNESSLLTGADDHSGLVLDGLVIDGGGRNTYSAKAPFELNHAMNMAGPLASFNSPEVVIRNCILINSATGAVMLQGEASRFENNIILNHVGEPMLVLREGGRAGEIKRPMVVRGNTFAFAHDETDPPMGKGGEKGIAIRIGGSAQIENNVFAACGNAAMTIYTKPDGVSLNHNVFWLNLRANISSRTDGRESLIKDKNLDEMEDLGFKSSKENKVADVGLTGLKPEWVEGVSRQMVNSYATPPKEALTAFRTKYGLPEPAKPAGDNDLGPMAPYLAPLDACALRVEGDAGARPVELKVELAAAVAAKPAPTYVRTTWAELNAGAPVLEGKPIEVLAAIGHERNGFLKQGITEEQYVGFDVYYLPSETLPEQIHVYAVRNGPAHRQWQESNKSTNGREAEDWYLLRGIGRLTGARQKATIEVQSIIPAQAPVKPATARPKGKEWFIRAGASGGDGTRDKPFRDPFQALEKAQDGDTLRVAGGDYFGKLRSASWKIANKYLAMFGGYDAEFKNRDPWKNPTRLVMSPEAEKKDKSEHPGQFLQSSEISDGFILDGFIFDGSTLNAYFDPAKGGGLDLAGSPIGAMVQLLGSNITVRNCLFVNASGVAVDMSCDPGTFENNLIINTSGTALNISAQGPGPWVIRRNTILFTMEPTSRASNGGTSSGSHLHIRGRTAGRIEGNIFGFADGQAIHTTTPRDKLLMDGNAFAGNLFRHFTDADRVWIFDEVWDRRLADAGLLSARDNSINLPAGLPIDKEYADRVFPRLFDMKGRYTREDWAKIAAAAGATVTPPAEATTEAAVVEKPKTDKPKEQSLEDLMGELDKLKKDSSKPTDAAAPKGPPYAPAYPWRAAIELVRPADASPIGARHVPLTVDEMPR